MTPYSWTRWHPRPELLRLLAELDREDRDERLRAARLPGALEMLAMAKSRRMLRRMGEGR
jgi:hypothetical protein